MHVDPHATPERLLHTMLRVGDLQRSIDFYTRVLGMRLLRREDHEDGRYTLAFVGYDDEDAASVLELTHNWDVDRYEIGTAYGHVALAVRDVALATARAAQHGAAVLRAAGPRSGHPTERIAFIADPDGYRIEFIERPDRASA